MARGRWVAVPLPPPLRLLGSPVGGLLAADLRISVTRGTRPSMGQLIAPPSSPYLPRGTPELGKRWGKGWGDVGATPRRW